MPKHSKPKPRPQSVRQQPSRQLWELADGLRRSKNHITIAEVIATAKGKSIPVSWEDVYALNTSFDRHGAVVVPSFITRFLRAYVKDKSPNSILDPWAGIGSLLL